MQSALGQAAFFVLFIWEKRIDLILIRIYNLLIKSVKAFMR